MIRYCLFNLDLNSLYYMKTIFNNFNIENQELISPSISIEDLCRNYNLTLLSDNLTNINLKNSKVSIKMSNITLSSSNASYINGIVDRIIHRKLQLSKVYS